MTAERVCLRAKRAMRRLPTTLTVSLLLLVGPFLGECWGAPSGLPPKTDFYVSVDGSDTWSGKLASPNAQGTDGPFASLERARDAVRDLKKSKSDDLVVLVREGTYSLTKTVVFGLEDSGKRDATITYAAYPGETPVFSSGREIKDWKKVSGKLPGLPKKALGQVWVANVSGRFFTLYDAEGMLPHSRSVLFP